MGFLDTIADIGSSVLGFFGSDSGSTAVNAAKAAGLALMLKEVTDSQKKDSERSNSASQDQTDYGVREQVDPDTDNKVPVLYGEAFIGGVITDAYMTGDNQTMYYCLTLCEKTGTLLSTSADSVISFKDVYWNENKIQLQSDGKTAASFTDEEGTVDTSISGLIEFYFYNNGSDSPTNLRGHVNPTLDARNVFPAWKSTHLMSGLVFCIVKVTYNKTNGVTGLGRMEFKLKNTMTQPGDCIYDYMTNTRYGAGIDPTEINA